MSITLGVCGCCSGGPGDPEEPPPEGFPGGDPDPGWVSGYYLALKRAQIVRDGFPDLRTYYRSITYDTGERFLVFDELTTDAIGGSFHDQRTFFNIAERLTSQGEFALFDAYFLIGGQPYNPLDCRNTQMFKGTTTPGWPYVSYYRLTGGHGGTADTISFDAGFVTVNAQASVPVPESVLDQIDGKLSVAQYRAGRIVLAAQRNPSTVIAQPVLDGLRAGTRWECQAVPAIPDFYDVGPILTVAAGHVFHAFNLTDRARGSTPDNRLPWTGLKLATTKQTVQVGFKSPVPTDPVLKTYRKFTIPDGFSLLPGRQPAEAQQVFGMKMPANAEFVEEVDLAIEVGQLINFDPDDQEVYFFDGRPFLFPQALPTVDEVLTPLVTKARLWRVFQPTYSRFTGELVSPLTVGTRWTHEDRCLKHEVSRSVNGGAEAVVATIDANPEEWPPTNGFGIAGWHSFIDPDNGIVQFPLGWEWVYYDTDVAPGNTYTYRVRGYYDAARKSAYSAAYTVEI